jgi:5-formyltetrahydrofolate cyclo-ligase
MSLSKDTMRAEALRHRDRIDASSPDESPEEAAALFFEQLRPARGQTVALYWPKGREFDTTALIERLLKEKIGVALPVVEKGSRVLRFARWNDSIPLVPGPFEVMQPQVTAQTEWTAPDIVVVPLLAFDRRGNRLGYGGGYYDATLRDLRARKEIVAVGMGYARQAVLFNLPAEAHDEKLDWIVTPQRAQKYS